MSTEPIDLLGGKSTYCINEGQLREAKRLAEEDPEAGPQIRSEIERLEAEMSRNERAALAFVLIDRLLRNAE
jgi:hypothetical protein